MRWDGFEKVDESGSSLGKADQELSADIGVVPGSRMVRVEKKQRRKQDQEIKEGQEEIVRKVERQPDQVSTSGSGVGGKKDKRREKEPMDIIISRAWPQLCGRQDSEVARRANSSCGALAVPPSLFDPYYCPTCKKTLCRDVCWASMRDAVFATRVIHPRRCCAQGFEAKWESKSQRRYLYFRNTDGKGRGMEKASIENNKRKCK